MSADGTNVSIGVTLLGHRGADQEGLFLPQNCACRSSLGRRLRRPQRPRVYQVSVPSQMNSPGCPAEPWEVSVQTVKTSVQVNHLLPSQAWRPVSLLLPCHPQTESLQHPHLYLPQSWIRVSVPSLHVLTWRQQLAHMPRYHVASLLGTVRALWQLSYPGHFTNPYLWENWLPWTRNPRPSPPQ